MNFKIYIIYIYMNIIFIEDFNLNLTYFIREFTYIYLKRVIF
jgi:hypothetical protein